VQTGRCRSCNASSVRDLDAQEHHDRPGAHYPLRQNIHHAAGVLQTSSLDRHVVTDIPPAASDCKAAIARPVPLFTQRLACVRARQLPLSPVRFPPRERAVPLGIRHSSWLWKSVRPLPAAGRPREDRDIPALRAGLDLSAAALGRPLVLATRTSVASLDAGPNGPLPLRRT
jgi:hypothetical protein